MVPPPRATFPSNMSRPPTQQEQRTTQTDVSQRKCDGGCEQRDESDRRERVRVDAGDNEPIGNRLYHTVKLVLVPLWNEFHERWLRRLRITAY